MYGYTVSTPVGSLDSRTRYATIAEALEAARNVDLAHRQRGVVITVWDEAGMVVF